MLNLSPARVRVLLAALVAGSLPAVPVCAQPGTTAPARERKTMVKFSLVTDKPATPGGTFTLGLRYVIADGWHTYWDGLNDTGMPASWQLELPPGWTAGEAQWPAPHRYGMENGVVDHVYLNEATILIPISVPSSAEFGDASIKVNSKWLVCQEACIPERGESEVNVQVIDRPANQPVPAAIQKTRDRAIVTGWGELDKLKPESSLKDAQLSVKVPGATKLAFFPAKDSSPAEDLIAEGEVSSDTLTVQMHQRKGEQLAVRGVIEVARKSETGTKTSWHYIDFTPGVSVDDAATTASPAKPAAKTE
ncbi:MAG TPA: protein-disulfide reductase DsbD domain-containing protein [Phycisphaerales bacterium]|nr:protein-disulfide reductase DsbD domain-containing protein [Phycisphaerales bacterium]